MDYTFWIPIVISIGALFWNFWQQRSIEKLKRENDKANLIHRIQFEKEFNIYSELWGSLIDLRNSTASLRPIFDSYDPQKTEEERKSEKLQDLNIAFMKCVTSFDNNRPFYHKDVYEEVKKAIRISQTEMIDFQHGDKSDRGYWDESKKNIDQMIDSIDRVCEIIRRRIGLVRIKE